MIRPLTIATFLMASGSGLYLYQSKHEAQVLDRTIERAVHETAAFREQSRLLVAEWTMLNDPESLRRFSNAYLALKTITPGQFSSLADLDGRLPQVQPPPSAHDPDEAEPVPIGTVSATGSPVRDVAQAASTTGVDDDPRARSRPVAAPPAAAALATPAQPPNRKLAGGRPSAADAASKPAGAQPGDRPTGADALGKRSVADAAPSARAAAGADPRNAEQHSNEQRAADRRAPQPADPRMADPKVTEVRSAMPLPQPRPAQPAAARAPQAGSPTAGPGAPNLAAANLVSADPAVTGRLPVRSAEQAQAQAPGGGSLLGMARGPVSPPVPRPTPVNATQPNNANQW